MNRRVLLATPVYERADVGQVAAHHAAALWALARNTMLDDAIEGAILGEGTTEKVGTGLGFVGVDLVRARSRFVADFLEARPRFTDLLFWDADVVGAPDQIGQCIRGMLSANKAIVGVPYPKKAVHLDKVAASGRVDQAHTYNFQVSREQTPDATGCVRADRVATGFMMIARSVLEQMTEHYRHNADLVFDDEFDGTIPPRETVALFQLIVRNRILLSEDYSFCARWTDLGGEIHLYLGPGAPLDHVGGYRFKGNLGGIFASRE